MTLVGPENMILGIGSKANLEIFLKLLPKPSPTFSVSEKLARYAMILLRNLAWDTCPSLLARLILST
jgi:hypothetical protein